MIFFTKLHVWIIDYLHAMSLYGQLLIHRHPPEHYLGYIDSAKVPVLLIPGVNTKWHFLKRISDQISLAGHPVYVVKKLGYNRQAIPVSAQIVRDFLVDNDLQNVIILAHSKGGLIGKEVLLRHNQDRKVIKVIAIAAPFLGSKMAVNMPDKALAELSPTSSILQDHNSSLLVNKDIISIYGWYDNHVWPTEHSVLEGAANIKVETGGHHQILSNPKTKQVVLEEIANITQQVR